MSICGLILWSVFFAGFGIFIHLIIKMSFIEEKRGEPTTLWWFITKRHWKFLLIIVVPIPFSVLAYFGLHPVAYDGRFVTYIAAIMSICTGSTQATDMLIGHRFSSIIKAADNDDGDQYQDQSISSVKPELPINNDKSS